MLHNKLRAPGRPGGVGVDGDVRQGVAAPELEEVVHVVSVVE